MAIFWPRGQGRPDKKPKILGLEPQHNLPQPLLLFTNHTNQNQKNSSSSTVSFTTAHYNIPTPKISKPKQKRILDAEEEKKPKLRVVRIRVSDPDATDSSSDEEDQPVGRTKVEVYEVRIPENSACSNMIIRPDIKNVASKEEKRTKSKEQLVKHDATSCSSSSYEEDVHDSSKDGNKNVLERPAGSGFVLFELPGPIPDLEELMRDANHLLLNFFEGLPDDEEEDDILT